jgi:hypothetical protein
MRVAPPISAGPHLTVIPAVVGIGVTIVGLGMMTVEEH